MAEEREASVQLLKTFAPLDGLKRDNLAALAKKVSVRTMPAGRVLFKEGDTDKRTVWVVAGMVELQEGRRTVAMIRGGTPDSRNPLSPQIPRKLTARTVDEVQYLAIDSDLLDVMITWDQTGTYEVAELQTQLENAQHRRLDDDAAADEGVPPHSAGEHPGDLPAHAARALQGRRSRHQAG